MPIRCWSVLTLLCLASLAGAEPLELSRNGAFANGLSEWQPPAAATCGVKLIDAEAGPYHRALQLQPRPQEGAPTWSIGLRQTIAEPIVKGDRLQLTVWLRSPDGCRIYPYLEEAKDPWDKSFSEILKPTPEWREYTLTGEALANYAGGGSSLGFHLAFDTGTVELAGIKLVDLSAPEQAARPTAEQPQTMITNGDFSQPWAGSWSTNGGDSLTVTSCEGTADYPHAVRLKLDPPAGQPVWSLGFGQAIDGTLRQGDAVYVRAWMRSPESCRATFIYELNEAPHTKSLQQVAQLTPEWQEYRFVARLKQSFRPGQSSFKWHLGHGPGTVEITGVRVENYGPAKGHSFDETIDWFAGRDNPDTWRAEAAQRIEQNRKGDLSIRVLDANGRPLPNAEVKVVQQRHAFRFGSAVPARRLVDQNDPNNQRFQQEVERLFNVVTFENDLKWPAKDGLAVVDQATQWLADRDIDVRGHCLVWGSYKHLYRTAKELRGEALRQAIEAHVKEYAGRLRGKLYLWDVVNEAGSNTEVWDEVGWENFANAFKWAKQADPDVQLCYNDYGILRDPSSYRDKVAARIQYLLDQGAPVDVLGLQSHLGSPFTPIVRVLELLDQWAAYGKPLEITEFDLGCSDDAVHAEYVRDFLTACFSHPAVQSFIEWGFWEGSHWRAKDSGAMIRQDWTKRPGQEAWEDLVLNQWWTRFEGRTDQAGQVATRAFYGKQQVTASAGGKTAEAVIELLPDKPGTIELQLK